MAKGALEDEATGVRPPALQPKGFPQKIFRRISLEPLEHGACADEVRGDQLFIFFIQEDRLQIDLGLFVDDLGHKFYPS